MEGAVVGTILFVLLVYGFITGFDDGSDDFGRPSR